MVLVQFHNCLSEVQWNLSNPTHQGTREMHRIVQDVRILRFYLSEHKFLSDVTGKLRCQIAQVPLYISHTQCILLHTKTETIVELHKNHFIS
jgi:hypothetical protein